MGRTSIRPSLRHYVHKAPEGEEFVNTKATRYDGVNDRTGYPADALQAALTVPTSNGYSVSLWVKANWSTAQAGYWQAFGMSLAYAAVWPTTMWENTIALAGASRQVFDSEWEYGLSWQERPNCVPAGEVLFPTSGWVANDTWAHYVFTSASTTAAAGANILYLNGASVDTGTGESATGVAKTAVPGGLRADDFYVNWGGYLDEPAIYDRVLTSSEVSDIYAAGKAVDLSGLSSSSALIHWWRMGDDGSDSNTSFVDQVGSADLTGSGFGAGYGIVTDGPPT